MIKAKELEQKIINWAFDNSGNIDKDAYFEEVINDFVRMIQKPLKIENLSIEEAQHHGGEGEGDQYWYVIKVTEMGKEKEAYFQVNGYWSSWDGVNWEGAELQRVYPRPVTTIEYFDKNTLKHLDSKGI